MIYRKATEKDIDQVIELRIELLLEENRTIPCDINKELKEYFLDEMDKNLLVMVAEENSEIVATSSIIIQKYPPSFSNKEGYKAYVANVYTMPKYRMQGISKKLLDELIKDLKERNISYIWLWSTDDAKEMYEKYGFKDLSAFKTMDYNIK
ncbi:MAG: GNAT family N-acetyltransferase [Peptostreptococcaceae bacterium]